MSHRQFQPFGCYNQAFGYKHRRRFLGRTHFCTKNLGVWEFFDQKTYIHFVVQETRIVRKLFISIFVIKKVVSLLELVVIINES